MGMQSNITTPEASVILPVFNGGEYLEEAIDSVLAQTFQNFELLLLNDGSTDNSLDILKKYAARDERCKVFSWPNKGLIKTLNEGIHLAKSEIIFRMDADDICIESRFEKQIKHLEKHPNCVAVGSKIFLIDAEGCPIAEFSTKLTHSEIDNDHLAGKGGSICHPVAAIRKKALNQIGGYHEQYPHAEDLDLFLRLAEIGELANLPDLLLKYRQHIASIGYAKNNEQQQSNNMAVNDARTRRGIGKLVSINEDDDRVASNISLSDVHRKWAWWALSAGNVATAKKHAFKAIKSSPFDLNNLRLLACVVRGY